MYLVAIMDWHSRKVLSWRSLQYPGTGLLCQCPRRGPEPLGPPEIFNTDQGAQFTSNAFTKVLKDNKVAISMDGRGRCQDNIFIERLWWTLKHQYIYLHSFDTGKSLRRGLGKWIQYYNLVRGHSSLDDKTPDEVYYGLPHPFAEAA
jgi:putative transposase